MKTYWLMGKMGRKVSVRHKERLTPRGSRGYSPVTFDDVRRSSVRSSAGASPAHSDPTSNRVFTAGNRPSSTNSPLGIKTNVTCNKNSRSNSFPSVPSYQTSFDGSLKAS